MLSPTALLDNSLELEAILPGQFNNLWHGAKETSPERTLALAVLAQAASDMRRFRGSRGSRERRLYRDAEKWVGSNDRSHAFTFVNICEAMRLSPTCIRAALLTPPTAVSSMAA